MNVALEKAIFYGIPVWTLIILLLFNFNLGPNALNRTFALASVIVLSITFIIGPLGKFFKYANRLKIYRKYLGLSAFVLIVIHTLLSVVFYYNLNFDIIFSLDNPQTFQVYTALAAFVIFFLMSITSSTKAIQLLGARNWKLLQTTGYLAMALVIVHFILANNTNFGFRNRIYALGIFVFGLLVVLVRIAVLLLVSFEKASKKK